MNLKNIKPEKISNVLDNIEDVYSYITNKDNPMVSDGNGYFVYFLRSPEKINEQIISLVNKQIKKQKIDFVPNRIGMHIARYTLDTNFKPQLQPHTDKFVTNPSVVLSVQLKSNTQWPLAVNEDVFTLDENEGIIFSGSDQLHWRPKKEFLDGEYTEVLLCTITDTTKTLSQEHLDEMENLRLFFVANNSFFKDYSLS